MHNGHLSKSSTKVYIRTMNIFLQQIMIRAILYLYTVIIQLNTICLLILGSNDVETIPHLLGSHHHIMVEYALHLLFSKKEQFNFTLNSQLLDNSTL